MIWLLLAVNLIIFNIQRPLGFVFLGLAALSIILGFFPWQHGASRSINHIWEDHSHGVRGPLKAFT